MYQLIQISKLNDFIFCPYSVYLHSIYDSFAKENYHRTFQKRGSLNHQILSTGTYSTKKEVLTDFPVYSEKLGLIGKVDIFDVKKGELVERKYKISKIYLGQKYQLYAQMVCLEEVGYQVKKLKIISQADNKTYNIPKPSAAELERFFQFISKIKKFDPTTSEFVANPNKCAKCIYNTLCEYAELT